MSWERLLRPYDETNSTAWKSLTALHALVDMQRQILDANRDLFRRQQDAAFDAASQMLRAWTGPTGNDVQAFIQRGYQAFEDFASAVRKASDSQPPQRAAQPRSEERPQQETKH